MRSRKPSSAPLRRDFGFPTGFDIMGLADGGIDARGGGGRSLFCIEVLLPPMLARLGDRDDGMLSSLADDAAVGAVAEAGRRTGRVGERGRGLVIANGEVGRRFLAAIEGADTGAFTAPEGRISLSVEALGGFLATVPTGLLELTPGFVVVRGTDRDAVSDSLAAG